MNKPKTLKGVIESSKTISGIIGNDISITGGIQAIGRDGVGLDFHWDGTKLGVKKENEKEYQYVDLRGKSTIDDLTDKHIYKALGYVPASTESLKREVYHLQVRDKEHDSLIKTLFEDVENLQIKVGENVLSITELYELIDILDKTKANLSDIPTKLSDLEIDIEIGKDFTEEINALTQNITKLNEIKADILYVDEQISLLSDDLKIKIDNNSSQINDLKNDLNKHVELANVKYNELVKVVNNKATIEQVEELQRQLEELDIPEHIDLKPIENNIDKLFSLVDSKADTSTVNEELHKIQSQLDNLDIPEGVDLTPVYDELSKLNKNKANASDIPTKVSQLDNDAQYITIADIPDVDLSDIYKDLKDIKTNLDTLNSDIGLKADKTDIPINISQLHNDKNYITLEDVPECDLSDIENSITQLQTLISNKADKVYVDNQISIIEEQINNLDIPDEVDLEPIYQTLKSLSDNKSDKAHVDSEVARLEKMIGEIVGGDEIDLSDYAKKVDLPTKLSELENDTKYITKDDVVEYDDSELLEQIGEINTVLNKHQLELSEIDGEIIIINSTIDKKADKAYVDTKLNGYYKKSETYTKDEVNNRIAQIIGNAPENLDTLEKLANALDNDDSFASTVTKELSNKVDKVDGKGLSSNDFTNTEKLKLDGVEDGANRIVKVSELINDIGYITLKEIETIQPQLDKLSESIINNKSEIDLEISNLKDKDSKQDLEINKRAFQSDFQKLKDTVDSLDIPEEVDLTPIISDIEKLDEIKADKTELGSEVSRLEKTIKDIVTGEAENRVRIIPYITDTPIMNEVYYKQLDKNPPISHWYPDDWGVWEVISQKHLKCKATRTYDSLTTHITGNKGTVDIKIVKEDKNDRHMLELIRDGKPIFKIRETKGDKEYSLKVKPGDRLTITSLFAGDVYLDYHGEDGDYRLYAYKNGIEERIANAYLVEKRLEDYTTKDESESAIELLDDTKADKSDVGSIHNLTTNNKTNVVNAINELAKDKATNEDIDNVLEAMRIVTEDLINKVLALDVDKAEKTYVDDKLKDKADKNDIPNKISQLENDLEYITQDDVDFTHIDEQIYNINKNLNNKADKSQLDDDIAKVNKTIKNLDEAKADQTEITRLESVIDNLDIPDEVDLEPINLEISNIKSTKANKSELPTKVSQLQNDTGYLTSVNWSDVQSKPSVFKPETHSHNQYLRKDGSDNEVTLGKGAMFETNFKNDNWSFINNYTGGGWARGLLNIKDKNNNNYLQIGGNGSGQNFTRLYIGKAWNDWNFSLNPNSNTVDIKGKLRLNDKDVATKDDIPTKTNQLINNSNYVTSADIDKKADKIIKDESNTQQYEFQVVNGRPGIRRVK